MLCPPQSSRFNDPDYIRWTVQTMKFLIVSLFLYVLNVSHQPMSNFYKFIFFHSVPSFQYSITAFIHVFVGGVFCTSPNIVLIWIIFIGIYTTKSRLSVSKRFLYSVLFQVSEFHEACHLILPWLLPSSSSSSTVRCPVIDLRPTTIVLFKKMLIPVVFFEFCLKLIALLAFSSEWRCFIFFCKPSNIANHLK